MDVRSQAICYQATMSNPQVYHLQTMKTQKILFSPISFEKNDPPTGNFTVRHETWSITGDDLPTKNAEFSIAGQLRWHTAVWTARHQRHRRSKLGLHGDGMRAWPRERGTWMGRW